jgi:hypothetical protein
MILEPLILGRVAQRIPPHPTYRNCCAEWPSERNCRYRGRCRFPGTHEFRDISRYFKRTTNIMECFDPFFICHRRSSDSSH